jgi:hypothetical protein
MTKEQIKKAINLGKKVYVNGFDWQVKKQLNTYNIVSNNNVVFCPLLNDNKELILKEAKYFLVN